MTVDPADLTRFGEAVAEQFQFAAARRVNLSEAVAGLTNRLDAIAEHVHDLDERLAELEHATPPDPDPDPPPTGGNIDRWLPAGFEAKVELPRGHIGAHADARTMDPPGNINGGTIQNAIIEIPKGYTSQFVCRNGTLRNVTIRNPHGVAVGNWAKHCDTYNCLFDGVNGDAWKAGLDETVIAWDCVVVMAPEAGSNRHYDGIQVFRNGHGEMFRCLIDWNAAGTVGHTTGALFTQDDASLDADDVTVLNPGGTIETLEFHGSGGHDLGAFHIWGSQEENFNGFGMRPRVLVSSTKGHRPAVVHNDVAGAETYKGEG